VGVNASVFFIHALYLLIKVRLTLKDTLIRSLDTEESVRNPDTHIMLLHGICTLAYNELTSVAW